LGLESALRVIQADARRTRIGERISLAFIDAAKEEYLDYLECIEDGMANGSIVHAHNTVFTPIL